MVGSAAVALLSLSLGSELRPSLAAAAEVTRVVSGFDERGHFDFNVRVSWSHDQKQAFIKREAAAAGAQSRLVNDLVYHQTRDVLNTRVEMGLMRDVGVHLEIPYVLRDDRALDFDQPDGQPCGGAATSADCVNQKNSTLLRDGILPGAGRVQLWSRRHGGRLTFQCPVADGFSRTPAQWPGIPGRGGGLGPHESASRRQQAHADAGCRWQVRRRVHHALRRRPPRRQRRRGAGVSPGGCLPGGFQATGRSGALLRRLLHAAHPWRRQPIR